jgi:hypothetical protein
MIQGKNKATPPTPSKALSAGCGLTQLLANNICVVNFNGLAGLGGGNPLSNVLLYPVHYQIYRVLINEI